MQAGSKNKSTRRWDGKIKEAKVLYIDNDKAFVETWRNVHEVKHSIPYESRPRVGDVIELTRGKDGQILLINKSHTLNKGHGMGY